MRALWTVAVALAIGCSTPIQHGLDETAANEVLTALERGGIEACKARDEVNSEAFVISVPKVHAVRALQILQSLGLPRGRRAGFGEVYKQASLVPTPTEERARYLEALAGEIERTLQHSRLREADVQKLVAGSVAGLSPEAVAVVVTPATEVPSQRAPALASVGPLKMDPASRKLLVGILLAGLAIIATLAILLFLTARRLAGLERKKS
jgi:type III secretory pathway lipoprotein EscJ